ncbi:hypothetical protein [Campylobacter blaseri]|uniref:Uncharacterized protein n=1 Tax=Campylobacter blaseri TaxID=2042961 RepID=A0A2P8QYH1_9BACT|nr:hypothetical protein [Campylobacter blaseri]PSM51299.1 hypothetical protein CQ405_08700 [Campylobacter blaseri]PSM52443.1 hypothetical protein CRN67_08705 [Campylobacter blaseri]
MLLDSKLIDGVIYFDGDNGMSQFARRNLNYILEKYENFEYFVTFNLKNPLEFLYKRRLISDLLLGKIRTRK